MNLSLGIVGLPNVGKSTLFNALTKLNALAANYPFATIEPNIGIVPVRDGRLYQLAQLSNSKEIIPAFVKFVDIAGLVKGASEGLGLGNKFLGHIKEVGSILHLVRLFQDKGVIHVENRIDPKSDIKIINTELILKDIETIDKRLNEVRAKLKAKSEKRLQEYWELLEALRDFMNKENLASQFHFQNDDQKASLADLNLITLKPMIYVANVDESHVKISQDELRSMMGLSQEDIVIPICVKMEADLVALSDEEQKEYLQTLGLNESSLDKIVRLGYKVLGLINFFTTGEKETRAWTITAGTKAASASGVIHSDFERHFIALEVVRYDDFITCGSWSRARELGKVRLEGREYIIQDGDVVIVRHNC